MELTTRDIVARAMFTEIEHSSHDYVCTSTSRIDAKIFCKHRFPSIYQRLFSLGIDMSARLYSRGTGGPLSMRRGRRVIFMGKPIY